MIKYKIEWNYFNSKEKYRTTIQEFNDEKHFQNFVSYCGRNEGYRKIIGYERFYEEKKEYSANDMQAAFAAGKAGRYDFEAFIKQHFKKSLT